MDFLNDIGGTVEIFFYFVTFFLASLPGRNSLLAIMNRLFVVKTSIKDMFEENDSKYKNLVPMSSKSKNEYTVDFTLSQLLHYKLQYLRCGLCLSWKCFKCIPSFKKYRRIRKLMKKGEERLIESISVQVIY
jgi:hypothetical protein